MINAAAWTHNFTPRRLHRISACSRRRQHKFNQRDRLVVLFDFSGVVRSVALERHTHEMPAL